MGFFDDFGGALIGGASSLIGGAVKAITGKQSGDREYERQKEFAQNGLRWKVEDAKAAGIHPIFAVGANTATYSPQAAVGSDFGLSDFGQNIGRAIEAKQTHEERMAGQRLNNMVGQAQARYYEAAANNQQAQADLAGQRAVSEALNDISGRGFLGDLELSGRNRLRTQPGQPPVMPTTDDYKEGNIIRMIALLEDPKGRLVSLTNTQNYHDNNEDVPIVEALPFLEGLTWDARAKITREPIKVGNKWYAHNGSEYKEVDVKTYKPYWKKWFMSERVPEVKSRQRSQSRGGIRAFYGG